MKGIKELVDTVQMIKDGTTYNFTDTCLRVYMFMLFNSENGVCEFSWKQIAEGIGKTKDLFKGNSVNRPDKVLIGVGLIQNFDKVGQKLLKKVKTLDEIKDTVEIVKNDISVSVVNERGLYTERLSDKDYLYVLSIEGKGYFKIGRTFNPEERFLHNKYVIQKHYGKEQVVSQIKLFTGKHSVVYATEQMLIGRNNGSLFNNYRPVEHYGSSELILNDKLEDVLEILENSLNNP